MYLLKISILFFTVFAWVDTDRSNLALKKATIQYRNLRTQPCHFCVKNPGPFNDHVDKFGSEMQQSMDTLVEELGKPGTPVSKINKYMGIPDEIISPETILPAMPGPFMSFQPSANNNSDEPIRLIYYWRGRHDYAYFDAKSDIVVNSGWHYDFE